MRYSEILNVPELPRKILVFSMLLLLAAAAGGAQPSKTEDADSAKVQPTSTLIIGHQGAAGLAPGNTLAAFTRAIDLGVDAIELDTLLTADGILVVHHDFTLHPERTRTGEGQWLAESGRIPIKDMTLAQLKTYDVGRLKPGSKAARSLPDQVAVDGQKIPTLQEVFEIIQKTGSTGPSLYIEIKTSPDKADASPPPQLVADKVVQLLQDHDLTARCKILSFDWCALARVKAIAPSIPTVYLTSKYKQLKTFNRDATLLWTAGIDPDAYATLPAMIKAAGGRYWGAKRSEIWRSHVQEAHEAGLKIYVWTVDSASDMRHFLDIGVDGIITNRPDVLQAVVANTKRNSTTN